MERSIIETMIETLPHSKIGDDYSPEEQWHEQDGGAEFIVTRHSLESTEWSEAVSLSVAGEPWERQRIIKEFIEIKGALSGLVYHDDKTDVDYATWLIPR